MTVNQDNSSMFTQWPDHGEGDIDADEIASHPEGARISLRVGAIPYVVEARVQREYDPEKGTMLLERVGEAQRPFTVGSTPDTYVFDPHTSECELRPSGREESAIETVATPLIYSQTEDLEA